MNTFKQEMKKKIQEYSNESYLDGYIKNEFLTEDGDADIFLNINKKSELFDTRTVGNQLDLNNSIYEYIEEKSSMLDNDIKLNLHIIGIDLDQKEKESIKHIIKEHFAIELYKIEKEYLHYKTKIMKLILVGLLSLLSYALLYLYTDFEFFLEVFGFIFSFALWKGIEDIIYSLAAVKNKREAITQNLLMAVEFSNEEIDEI